LCSTVGAAFSNIEKIGRSRFADLPADWRSQRGWEPIARAA
jgi:sarcosine oxidase subunit beta